MDRNKLYDCMLGLLRPHGVKGPITETEEGECVENH